MIKPEKPAVTMTAKQRDFFNQLTTAQQIRMIEVLEMRQKTGRKRVIKVKGANKAARAKQVSGGIALDKGAKVLGDAVSLTNMYGSQLD